MRCLSVQEAEEWISSVGIQKNDHQALPVFRTFLPDKSFHNQEIGRELIDLFGNWKYLLVWLFDWPMYKRDQMAVILELRKSSHEKRNLIDAPAHLFSSDEKDLAAGITGLCLLYSWDFRVISPGGFAYVESWSHDEVMDIYCKDEALLKKKQSRFHELDIKTRD